jgi:hypothetical protein
VVGGSRAAISGMTSTSCALLGEVGRICGEPMLPAPPRYAHRLDFRVSIEDIIQGLFVSKEGRKKNTKIRLWYRLGLGRKTYTWGICAIALVTYFALTDDWGVYISVLMKSVSSCIWDLGGVFSMCHFVNLLRRICADVSLSCKFFKIFWESIFLFCS